jgi:hypothetical protein
MLLPSQLPPLNRMNTLLQAWPYSMRIGTHTFKYALEPKHPNP